MSADTFSSRLLAWFGAHGRHDLPWQHPRSPYRVWLSEIMLQQTQVAVATGYFERFVAALPTLAELACASQDQVLALWSGLGYYSRARNLHAAARACVERHGGELPDQLDALLALPGIGRSTAGAILAQAHGRRAAILDGNVKRLLARFHGVEGWPGSGDIQRELWRLSESHLPHERLVDYTQALMDFGATVCTRARPACDSCPLATDCVANRLSIVARVPASRPTRALPHRSCVMLVLLNGDARVLLARRPPAGVWAGLWSLPEHADAAAANAWLELHAQAALDGADTLPTIEHGFSHYRLSIQPFRLRLASACAAIADDADALRWAGAGDLHGLGLPAPVRRLLERVLPAVACPAIMPA